MNSTDHSTKAPWEVPAQELPANSPKPIEPITETDMRMLTNLFERFANTIVSHSELMREVETLRKNQSNMQELVDLKAAYNQLRDEYDTVRADRDQLREENAGIKQRNIDGHNQVVELQRDVERLTNHVRAVEGERDQARAERDEAYKLKNDTDLRFSELEANLEAARKDRDDHGMKFLEMEEKYNRLQADFIERGNTITRVCGERDTLAHRLDTIKAALQG